MRQQNQNRTALLLLGGDKLRFLLEEPVQARLQGVQTIIVEHGREWDLESVDSNTPLSLVVDAEFVHESLPDWILRIRQQYPRLPMVVLNRRDSVEFDHDFLPQLVEPVAIIQYPCTQRSVIEAIEKSISWSKNLCRMLEQVDSFVDLSDRELAIVSMATDGVPNKTIARRLNVSVKTVEKNRHNAYRKLGVFSASEMAALVTFRRYFDRSSELSPGVSMPLATDAASIAVTLQATQ